MKRKKNKKIGLIGKFLPYYKPYGGIMAFDLFCAALTTICELVLPMVVRTITNAASSENLAALTPTLIFGIGGMYILLRIIDTAANYFMTSIGHIMGTRSRPICAAISSLTCKSFPSPIMTTPRLAR